MLSGNAVRQKFLDFFKKQGAVEIPSAPLVPENDPSTLFTSCGMQPLVPYLLGEIHPSGSRRLVNSQKSFRSQDIAEVGDNRHTTFFEMLGNWSLGDYFKKEQLRWFFTFLTEEIGLAPNRLYVSAYEGNPVLGVPQDEEAVAVWQELFAEKGIKAKVGERIFLYGDKKNWWSRSGEPDKMPVGEPGGPDSEVFFDFDPDNRFQIHQKSPYADSPCHPNCDCGRFLEIGNSVFMQYKKEPEGVKELIQKNVDFGGGLERILAAAVDTPDIFQTDLFLPIMNEIEKMGGNKDLITGQSAKRIIADHLRASVFLIADGVYPGNKAQGYFLRRLLRRAMLYGHKIGFDMALIGKTIGQIANKVFNIYLGSPFEELLIARKQDIICAINDEGEKFGKSLQKGLREINRIPKLSGKIAFSVYETYGFPLELLEEIAKDKNQNIDREEFRKEFQKHQELSRTASAGMFKGGLEDASSEVIRLHSATHLLHQALRHFLGEEIVQKGSNITKNRLRFDFTCKEKISQELIKKIENLVNEQIDKKMPVKMEIMTLSEAKSQGSLAFFPEKYGDKVKVYSIGDFSKEVCGGPHVENTCELGHFSIIKEESVGRGIRRIYAVLK